MIAKTLLPVFAVLSVAAAQASICSQPTATITNQAQAAQYTGCTRIKGDVVISPDAANTINLDGPDEITGKLIVKDAGDLTVFGSTTIETIGDSFTLTNLTRLNRLVFPALTQVKEINWITLQALDILNFDANVTKASKVVIGNTFLSTLKGINLNTVDVLDISNNNRLRLFTSDLANVTTSLDIGNNGQKLDLSFPKLTWAATMNIRNVSSISIPSLGSVNGSLGFYSNFFESVDAPKLTSVGAFATGIGSLAFVANGKLTEIGMDLLKSVGGAYQIANNTLLGKIDFPALEKVGGAVDFSGNFETPSLPLLNDVRGGFNMQSKVTIDCTKFQSLRNSQVIQGVFTCKTTDDAKSNDGTTTDGGSGSGGASASPTPKKGAADSYRPGSAVAGLSFFGSLLGMLL